MAARYYFLHCEDMANYFWIPSSFGELLVIAIPKIYLNRLENAIVNGYGKSFLFKIRRKGLRNGPTVKITALLNKPTAHMLLP